MPRPKKPSFYPSCIEITPLHLDSNTQKTLKQALGIENQKRITEMPKDVEEILMMHQYWVEYLDKGPTPGSKIRSLKALQNAAKNLFNQILRLDIYTRDTLYSHVPYKGSFTPLDPEAVRKADLQALIQIIERSKNALESLEHYKKPGKPRKMALRETMALLSFLFNKYAAKNRKKRDRRNFISCALDAAQIDYPQLVGERTKFDNLLKGSF
jgi:hypothetical protein